jgi:hypothetical protein
MTQESLGGARAIRALEVKIVDDREKHPEHIYEKVGVQTRLSAVMYALEHLGIFS